MQQDRGGCPHRFESMIGAATLSISPRGGFGSLVARSPEAFFSGQEQDG